MASFTKKVLGLAAVATSFAGMAFGQSTCTGGAPQTNIIRAEGTAEQVGQFLITCTGAGVAGTGSLQVFLSPALPVTSRVITAATGLTEAVATIGAVQTQGTVSGSTINFSNIALPGGTFTITISNVRVNATSLSVGAGVPPSVSETAFITGSAGTIVPAVIASQQVAFVQNGLGATGVFQAVGLAAAAGVTQNFVNCVAQTPGLAGVYRITENFAQAFKNATDEANQVAVPGQAAVISTRIKVNFANVPAGVTILLPLTVTSGVGGAVLTWVTSDTNTTAAATDNNPNGGAIAATSRAVSLSSGAGSVTYAILGAGVGTSSDLANLDRFDIPVNVVTAANGVTASTTPFTVSSNLAPVGSTSVPNFAVGSSTTTTTFSTFSQCSTSLLFPFVTNQLGFDTGIAISNTSTDPFVAPRGATAQAGTCSLNFYGSGAPSPANVTTPNVPTGTVYTQVLSGVAAGFQGYIIAQCNFQYAHGFAFITNGVGVNGGLSQGYLAGVIPDTNQVNRRANDASKALAGSGETLGN